MIRSKFKNEDIYINEIINEINNEKRRINEFKNNYVNDDKCINLILSLFRNFFSNDINEGIYAVIFNNFDLYRKLTNVLFIDNNVEINIDICDEYRMINSYVNTIDDDKVIIYSDGINNYIYLDNKNIVLMFRDNVLNIEYKSELGVSENNIYLLDDDGIVTEKRIERKMESIKLNGIDGYRCINNIIIKRDNDNIGYVKILEEVKIYLEKNIICQFDKRCAGYIDSSNLLDLSGNLNLSSMIYDYVNDRKSCLKDNGLLDIYFNDIKNNLIYRLNKNKGFSKKIVK